MKRWQIATEDGAYRCLLGRCLDSYQSGMRYVTWVLNNPSVADANHDDPTIRRLWAFTLDWGYPCMTVVNTNPHRATDPKEARVPAEDVLAINDAWLIHEQGHADKVICGWGDKANRVLADRTVNALHQLGPVYALRVTKQGNPQHPLYLPGDLQPTLWNPEKWLN